MMDIINYNFMTKPAKYCLDMSNDWYKQHGVTRGNPNGFNIDDMKDGDILFVKTDFIFNGSFVDQYLKHIKKNFILITGVSSFSIDEGSSSYMDILKSPYLIKWFCTNPPIKSHSKIEWLPIGFEEPEREGGDIKVIRDFYDIDFDWEQKIDKIYIPFHGNTFSSRSKIINSIAKYDFVDIEPNRLGFYEYLSKISKYKYVLSLRGAGWDCHRHYECLLVNSVPIMDGSPLISNFKVNGMPVLDLDKISKKMFARYWDFKSSRSKLLSKNYTDKIFNCQKDFVY